MLSILISTSVYTWLLARSFQGFWPKICMHYLRLSYMLCATPIITCFIYRSHNNLYVHSVRSAPIFCYAEPPFTSYPLVPRLHLGVMFLMCPQFMTFCCLMLDTTFPAHTGCPRRNGPDFGRVFLRSNYTDITQNTYIQSSMVTEIMAIEVWNFDSYYSLIDYQIHIETGRNVWFL